MLVFPDVWFLSQKGLTVIGDSHRARATLGILPGCLSSPPGHPQIIPYSFPAKSLLPIPFFLGVCFPDTTVHRILPLIPLQPTCIPLYFLCPSMLMPMKNKPPILVPSHEMCWLPSVSFSHTQLQVGRVSPPCPVSYTITLESRGAPRRALLCLPKVFCANQVSLGEELLLRAWEIVELYLSQRPLLPQMCWSLAWTSPTLLDSSPLQIFPQALYRNSKQDSGK